MQKNYNVTGARRKALISKISELTSTRPVYLGMPTAAFRIGPFEVSRIGTLIWDDRTDAEELIAGLRDAGFCAEGDEPLPVPEGGPVAEPAPEPAADEECIPEPSTPELAASASEPVIPEPAQVINAPDPVRPEEIQTTQMDTPSLNPYSVTLPDTLSDTQFLLLNRIIQGKQTLLKHAFRTPSVEIIRTDGIITFPWFAENDPAHMEAYTVFLQHLVRYAAKAVRATTRDVPVENEKYAFRCFMLRIGIIGKEYTPARKILMENLTGNTAWKGGRPEGV